ncbi:putative pterin-4-alpha-carbinolamine dehydratase [wastewater metagenome]|uniref:4a-hydroxytetrahydrobiopterin dehydratase n=2 Tax=unclassified sequences TaxID=12908 RepID=A0A5B8R9I2_9ZZZZ|nr:MULTISPECIES: 4a-hydroxytetrahydrobiopterin dehydratase [Arhodomonas]QEA05400.1 putative pterin-4-alpha-carbinolamine dehydratase [uncultured organism]
MALSEQSCTPCRGGTPPMSRDEAERHLGQLPEWRLEEDPMRIIRAFRFGDFASALAFVNQVSELAEGEQHHPEIHFGWGHVEVEIWTHKIQGLHENDFILAAKIDRLI